MWLRTSCSAALCLSFLFFPLRVTGLSHRLNHMVTSSGSYSWSWVWLLLLTLHTGISAWSLFHCSFQKVEFLSSTPDLGFTSDLPSTTEHGRSDRKDVHTQNASSRGASALTSRNSVLKPPDEEASPSQAQDKGSLRGEANPWLMSSGLKSVHCCHWLTDTGGKTAEPKENLQLPTWSQVREIEIPPSWG